MNSMYWAVGVLTAFVVIWFLFVAPAERRHHERKLAVLQKKLDERNEAQNSEKDSAAGD